MSFRSTDERRSLLIAEEDPLRTWLLGPDAVLVTRRVSETERLTETIPPAEWLLEFDDPEGDTIRVLIAGGSHE
jgi:hypothetical protein